MDADITLVRARKPERFWRHTTPVNGCLIWKGHLNERGYGSVQFQRGRERRTIMAHRVAWMIANGPVPDGCSICHQCDVRACVEPSHLFPGTPQENMDDCVSKGRIARGERHGCAKLTAAQVVEIRARYLPLYGVASYLAREYGMTRSQIANIGNGRTWRATP